MRTTIEISDDLARRARAVAAREKTRLRAPVPASQLRALLAAGRIVGPRVYDARIAAPCRAHGVRELWSVDRDFGRFPSLTTAKPLAG